MEVSESLRARAVTALWIEEDGGHWRSTLKYDKTKFFHRMKIGNRRISQLLVLRTVLMGDPVGQLSNACGRSECVNPYHYRDQSEREQLTWRTEVDNVNIVDLLAKAGLSIEDLDYYGMRIISIDGLSPSEIYDRYGMTHYQNCYCEKESCPNAAAHKGESRVPIHPFGPENYKTTRYCNTTFDPLIEDEYGKRLTPGNGVICPACWTDEDQKKSEESDAD